MVPSFRDMEAGLNECPQVYDVTLRVLYSIKSMMKELGQSAFSESSKGVAYIRNKLEFRLSTHHNSVIFPLILTI